MTMADSSKLHEATRDAGTMPTIEDAIKIVSDALVWHAHLYRHGIESNRNLTHVDNLYEALRLLAGTSEAHRVLSHAWDRPHATVSIIKNGLIGEAVTGR